MKSDALGVFRAAVARKLRTAFAGGPPFTFRQKGGGNPLAAVFFFHVNSLEISRGTARGPLHVIAAYLALRERDRRAVLLAEEKGGVAAEYPAKFPGKLLRRTAPHLRREPRQRGNILFFCSANHFSLRKTLKMQKADRILSA